MWGCRKRTWLGDGEGSASPEGTITLRGWEGKSRSRGLAHQKTKKKLQAPKISKREKGQKRKNQPCQRLKKKKEDRERRPWERRLDSLLGAEKRGGHMPNGMKDSWNKASFQFDKKKREKRS